MALAEGAEGSGDDNGSPSMRVPTSSEIEILRSLFSAGDGRLDLYGLHQKFKLSPGQMSRTCRAMEELEVLEIERDGDDPTLIVCITDKGRRWIFEHRRELFLQDRTREWAEPMRRLSPSVAAFEPYMPKPHGRKLTKGS